MFDVLLATTELRNLAFPIAMFFLVTVCLFVMAGAATWGRPK